MAYIGNPPTIGQWRKLDDISSSFNGATTTFTTSVGGSNVTAGSANQLFVSLGGVIQQPNVDYSVTTNSIIFTTAPASGLDFFAVLAGDALNAGTPGDGTVTTAKLAGNLTVDLDSGSAAAPSLTFDPDTGLYSPGADQIAISTNGTAAVTVDSSQRVGIGTTTPTFTTGYGGLHINYDYPEIHLTNVGSGATATDGFKIQQNSGQNVYFWNYENAFLAFATNNAERARIDSSGRLLVGTSSSSADTFQVIQGRSGASSGNGVLLIARGSTPNTNGNPIGTINFSDNGHTTAAEIEVVRDGATWTTGVSQPTAITFSTTADGASSPTEQLRITSDRYVRLASGTGGIQFNGDTASANALDDYEEGTWTPVVEGATTAGTGTYSVQQGNYTKIGDTVFVQGYVVWTAHTGTGNLRIASLPFTSNPATQYRAPVTLGYVRDLAITAGTQLTAQMGQNVTYFSFFEVPHGGGNPTSVAIDTAAYIAFSITYKL